jgi:hypothetical protein
MKINLRMEILDSLADTGRGIEQIERLFCVLFNDVVANSEHILFEIEKLLSEKLIFTVYHDEEENYDWYEMTSEGWAIWDAFDWDTYFEETKSLRREDDDE